MSENYEKVVSDLSMLIEQFPDIPNSVFSDDKNWEKPTFGYVYAKSLAVEYGQDWPLHVKKMTLTTNKTINFDWIAVAFPNLEVLWLTGSAKIKSLKGLEKLNFLKVLTLEKLSNWKTLSDLSPLSGLYSLSFQVVSKDLKIDLTDLPKNINTLSFESVKLQDLQFVENLDFTQFTNLTSLQIVAANLGDGSSIKLPSTLKEFSLYRNVSLKDLSILSPLSEDCRIVFRSLHLSSLKLPKAFKNITIFPHD